MKITPNILWLSWCAGISAGKRDDKLGIKSNYISLHLLPLVIMIEWNYDKV